MLTVCGKQTRGGGGETQERNARGQTVVLAPDRMCRLGEVGVEEEVWGGWREEGKKGFRLRGDGRRQDPSMERATPSPSQQHFPEGGHGKRGRLLMGDPRRASMGAAELRGVLGTRIQQTTTTNNDTARRAMGRGAKEALAAAVSEDRARSSHRSLARGGRAPRQAARTMARTVCLGEMGFALLQPRPLWENGLCASRDSAAPSFFFS